MTDQSNREKEIFEQALDLASAEERFEYLKTACGDDTALLARVQALLRADEAGEEFLPEQPKDTIRIITEKPGDTIGRYKLLQQIGEGGCGVVYMAEQAEPVRRRVALKIIKLGMDTKSVIARFEAERQALALMDHPNIAKVFDAGATDTGRPYFVMELVRGIKITDYCDQNNLSTEERLKLFTQVCHAIQHAHQKGVIHRDIKPSNILVTVNDAVPVPKIIDFGIAKATNQQPLTDKTLFTAFEQFIGTPAYMSPEQAVMTSLDIDTRSDIYSLGVLLYELLTGKTPFDANELLKAGLDELRRTIREQEPPKPSTRLSTMLEGDLTTTAKHRQSEAPKLIHLLRGDLDWIVMKALEKDRTRRYETVNGLARDVQRYLDNEPIVARPPSRLYRVQKLVRRNKLAVAAASAVATALLIGLGISTWMFFKEQAAHQRALAAEKEQVRLRQQAQTEAVKSQQVAKFLKDMLDGVGHAVAISHDTTPVRELLDNTVKQVEMDFRERPEVEADLLQTIGGVYFQTGPIDQAEAAQRKALSIKRNLRGDHRLDIAESLSSLGLTLWREEKLAEAEKVLRESRALQIDVLGADNPQMAMTLVHLGSVLNGRQKLDESETILREALRLSAKATGNGDWKLACPLRQLGQTLEAQGKLAEAEQTMRAAVAADRELLGNDDFWTGESLRFLGGTLHRAGKSAEAEPTLRESLAIFRKVPSQKEGPHLGWVLKDLAAVLRKSGRAAEAEGLEQEASAIKTRYQPVINETSQ